MTREPASADDTSSPPLQFIPVKIAQAAGMASAAERRQSEPPAAEEIHVELTRGATQLSVRWPSAQADACAAWLRELVAVALKD